MKVITRLVDTLLHKLQRHPASRVSPMSEADRERFFSALCDTQFPPQYAGNFSLCRAHWRAAKQEAPAQLRSNLHPKAANYDPNVAKPPSNVVQLPLKPIQLDATLEPAPTRPLHEAVI